MNIDEWRQKKNIYKNMDDSDLFALGFATFYLNRTNRSGIIDGAGPIGGFSQDNEWKIDARFPRQRLISSIRKIAAFACQINISNLDAYDFISNKIKSEKNFLYLDPPYFVKGSKLYKNSYKECDHVLISQLMAKNRERPWIISYDNVDPIRTAYSDFVPFAYSLNYSAGIKSIGSEVMFFSDYLQPPSAADFLGI